jgi:hypothetical protein
MLKAVGGLALAAVAVILLSMMFLGGQGVGSGAIKNVGLGTACAVSTPLDAEESGWTPPTDAEWAAAGCQPPRP